MIAIAAVDEKWNIGRDGDLLVRIPPDLKRFQSLTLGKTVVMGRKTLASLPGGRPLPGRQNIVMSQRGIPAQPGLTCCDSLETMMEAISDRCSEDIFVIGGGEIYALLLPQCTKAHITKIHRRFLADTQFPNLDLRTDWHLEAEEGPFQYEGLSYSYCSYIRS